MEKKIIFGALLTIFIVFAIFSIFDDVSAAKWKKYDSGKHVDNYPPAGYKNVGTHVSYIKEDKKIIAKFYNIKKNNNKKHLATKLTISKTKKKNIVKIVEINDYKRKQAYFVKTKHSLKKIYGFYKREYLRLSSKSPEKTAFDKQIVSANGSNLKIYGIKTGKSISFYGIYKKEELFSGLIYKNKKNEYIIEMFNQKRKMISKKIINSNSLKSVYYEVVNKSNIINKYFQKI